VREFYCITAETMIKKFPFHDGVLQGIGYLNPNTKEKISPEDGNFFLILEILLL
jgi:hypothetical protein